MPWDMPKLSFLEVWPFFLWHMRCHGSVDRGAGAGDVLRVYMVCIDGHEGVFGCFWHLLASFNKLG